VTIAALPSKSPPIPPLRPTSSPRPLVSRRRGSVRDVPPSRRRFP
jgi:hypothetical protein